MKQAILHEDAEVELKAAVNFYEDKSAGLGLDLEERVRLAVQEIEARPTGFPFHRVPPIRKRHLKRFRYTIYYVELAETIWILAVAHNRLRPDYWRYRLG